MPNPKGVSNQEAYRRWKSSAKELKTQRNRNKNRRDAMKSGRVKHGDGKHIDHKDGIALNHRASNLSIISANANLRNQ